MKLQLASVVFVATVLLGRFSSTALGSAVDDLQREVSILRYELGKLANAPRVTGGSSYIRWGRTTCEGNSVAVYRGYAAGPLFSTRGGGGSNYLCLHEQPQWKRHVPGFATWSGTVYGVEYEFFNRGHPSYNNEMFTFQNNGDRSVVEHPAPCVACKTPDRVSVLMIPARTSCPSGWTKEYQGYIVSLASINGYYRTSNICMDEAPETAIGGINQNSKASLIYPVQVGCGSLPCSRFRDGWELTCVVCTK